jgi:nitroreductase
MIAATQHFAKDFTMPADIEIAEQLAAQTVFQDRYRDPSMAPPAQWNETLETLIAHRSVRHFLTQPLPPGTVELLVAAAQSASSSSNLQVWSVVTVEDPETKARLAEYAGGQKHIRVAPLFVAWLADLRRIRSLGEQTETPTIGAEYLEMGITAMVDAALAAQNAFVAVESLGLGAVYIGAMRNHPEKVAELLGLPPNVFCVFGMCVGWPDLTAGEAIKPRLPQSVVVHTERYAEPDVADIAAYNARIREFQSEQKMAEVDWSHQSVGRVKDIKGLMGRERMREALDNLKFPLK